MKISMNKKYRTRDGQSVRVICIDRDAPYPVVALIGANSFIETFTSDGGCGSLSDHPNDLVEVSEWDDFKIDEPVMVTGEKHTAWTHAHFAGVNNEGFPTTWLHGKTSWSTYRASGQVTTNKWARCRRPTKEELEQ